MFSSPHKGMQRLCKIIKTQGVMRINCRLQFSFFTRSITASHYYQPIIKGQYKHKFSNLETVANQSNIPMCDVIVTNSKFTIVNFIITKKKQQS